MELRPNIKAVFLDFDGVILESADIKTEAFSRLFESYPRQRKKILSYHLKNVGVSRYRKFDYIFKSILRRPLSRAQRQALGRQFSRIVLRQVLRCAFVGGVQTFIKRVHTRQKLFVVSGTPQKELREIVRRRGLARYFRGVYGSPKTKEKILGRLLKKERLDPQETLYIGDGLSDQKAARRWKVPFLARVAYKSGSLFPKAIPKIRDFKINS